MCLAALVAQPVDEPEGDPPPPGNSAEHPDADTITANARNRNNKEDKANSSDWGEARRRDDDTRPAHPRPRITGNSAAEVKCQARNRRLASSSIAARSSESKTIIPGSSYPAARYRTTISRSTSIWPDARSRRSNGEGTAWWSTQPWI